MNKKKQLKIGRKTELKKKQQLKINYPIKTNVMPKLSLWLIVIVPIILFDKFVDVSWA